MESVNRLLRGEKPDGLLMMLAGNPREGPFEPGSSRPTCPWSCSLVPRGRTPPPAP
ncbi:MAG: hypothetical protein U0599_12305 [Vicinamibacteria bacterium]